MDDGLGWRQMTVVCSCFGFFICRNQGSTNRVATRDLCLVLHGIRNSGEHRQHFQVSFSFHSTDLPALNFRNVLASASADKSVKVWDMEKKKCVATAKHHADKAID